MPSSYSFSSLESLSLADRVLFNRFSKGPECPIPYNVAHHAFEAVALAHPDLIAHHHISRAQPKGKHVGQRADTYFWLEGWRSCCVGVLALH
ncbi:hypothetical protein LB505_010063 [Fusarium chuoi]|nr:hypothetical protein LB505_010063 [Fusarium chuoi]